MPRSARPSMPLGALTHDRVAYSGLARSAAGVKVASALRMCDGPWPADADRLSHFAQVVVQLMIPPGQLVHLRLRDRQGIQAGMRRRGGLVLEPVEHMHRHAWWQPRAELARQLELVAGPAALADERSGDQHDRREPSLRRLLGERMDEDCRACRMAGHDRAVVQVRHLAPDRCAPPGITRVALVGHARVADLVPAPELSPQALDQLVVPLVVRARAAALDEQDLPGTCHGDPLHAFVTTRVDTHRRPSLFRAAASLVEGRDGLRREHPQSQRGADCERCAALALRSAVLLLATLPLERATMTSSHGT